MPLSPTLLIGVAFACVGATPLLSASAQAQKRSADPNRPVALFVVDMAGNDFQLTSSEKGVLFDVDGNGSRVRTGWTAAGGDDGFLFLDTNGNGRVDSGRELLGNGWSLAVSPCATQTATVGRGIKNQETQNAYRSDRVTATRCV